MQIDRKYLFVFCAIVLLNIISSAKAENQAWLLTISGAIGPAVSDYVTRGIADAEQAGANLIILKIDTPGGLDLSMRDIVQQVLNSKIPVVGYVSPEGARAASAGTYILYACHIAAMAPATNLGAATPVQMGPSAPAPNKQPDENAANNSGKTALEKKQVNDAVAYIRGLADLRGRNGDWAEKAVRQGVALDAGQALNLNVIDFMANDLQELLELIDGKTVSVGSENIVLRSNNLDINNVEPDWRSELLAVITNPNLAYVLLLIGIYGLIFEFSNPGLGGPGIIGVICLLLAFYALQILPVSYVGLALILVGIALMVAEAFAPSFGILGLGGGIAFVVGSVMLMDTELPAYQIAYPLIAGFAVSSLLLFVFGINMAIRAHKHKNVSGQESWIGKTGVALEDFQGKGHIWIEGERWQVQCDQAVNKDDELEVQAIKGLALIVKKKAGDS